MAPDSVGKVTIKGSAELDWRMNDDIGAREYRFPGSGGGRAATFPRREPGPNAEQRLCDRLPELFRSSTLEIVLPNKGQGFSVRGLAMVGHRVASSETVRSAELRDGVARFVRSESAPLAANCPGRRGRGGQ
ncbi:hypothetical protein ACRAWD_07675 [Caulobacter segnis]